MQFHAQIKWVTGTMLTLVMALPFTSGQTPRRTLERPPEYDLPSLSTTTSRTRASVNSRSNSKIPDPAIFDGSKFPPEERPERGLLANMERPGEEAPPVKGPGQEEGSGGQQAGGGQEQPQMAGGGGGGGGGGEGEEGEGGAPSAPNISGLPPIAESGGGGGGEGEEGPEGEPGQPGSAGSPDAPKTAANSGGRKLDKPEQMQIGDSSASLAEADIPRANASAQLDAEKGEARMQVKAAQGNQPANRSKGTERGKDIPSNL